MHFKEKCYLYKRQSPEDLGGVEGYADMQNRVVVFQYAIGEAR